MAILSCPSWGHDVVSDMEEDDSVLVDVKAGQFAVVSMADGGLKAFRVAQVWAPGEAVFFCGRDLAPASYQRVHLKGLCLTWAKSILRVLDSEVEVRVFELEQEVESVKAELLRERESHARSRDKLRLVRQALDSVGNVLG